MLLTAAPLEFDRSLRPRAIVCAFFLSLSDLIVREIGDVGGNADVLGRSGTRVLWIFVGRCEPTAPTPPRDPLLELERAAGAGRIPQLAVRGRADESTSSAEGFGHADF